MPTRPADRRWVRADGVLWRQLPDGVLVLTDQITEPVAIRGSAASVWPLLVDPTSIATLTDDLAGETDAPHDRVAADIAEVVDALAAVGAVVDAATGDARR